MLVFWWQGKGYWALLLLFLIGMLATMVVQGLGLGTEGPWFVAGVLGIGTVANWNVGSRWNAYSRTRRPGAGLWKRLTYGTAEHRFMSLPMESASVAMATGAVLLLLRGILN